MNVYIRNKHTKSTITNVIRIFDNVQAYSIDKELAMIELIHQGDGVKVLYPLSSNEYITIDPSPTIQENDEL